MIMLNMQENIQECKQCGRVFHPWTTELWTREFDYCVECYGDDELDEYAANETCFLLDDSEL